MFSKPHKIFHLIYPSIIWRHKTNEKKIWLTFDDGPHSGVTPWLLTVLKKHKIKATFFLTGKEILKYPDLFSQIKKEGHVIGNHSFSHYNGWLTNNATYLDDIEKCQELMPKNKLFRPPFGKVGFNQIRKIKKKYKIILWDILTMDFSKNYSPKKIEKNILNNVKKGSIIVFHNNLVSKKNVTGSLENIIIKLKERGFSCSSTW